MKHSTVPFTLVILLAVSGENVFAPPANSGRHFTRADGLAEDACRFVTVGMGGSVLVGHRTANTISVYDGYEFTQIPAPSEHHGRVHESPGGQLWGIAPEGLLEFREGAWVRHRAPEIAAHFRAGRTNEIALLPVRQGRVLVLVPDRLLQFDAEAAPPMETLLRTDQTSLGTFATMTPARDGTLWISGARGFIRSAGPARNLNPSVAWTTTNTAPADLQNQLSGGIPPTEPAAREIFDVAVEPGGVRWLATSEGLIRRTPAIWQTSERRAPARLGPDEATQLRAASEIGALPALPEETANHTEWTAFLRTWNGDVWLGGAQDIAWRQRDVWRVFSSTNQLGPEIVLAFAEAPDGRVWCATPDKVWEFDGQNWLALRGGFAPINALHCARNGTLWVATDDGLHRYARGAWIANGTEDGLLSAGVKHVLEDETGRIFAETATGRSEFQPEADPDPPRTIIHQPADPDRSFREGATVTLTFGGRDKWQHTADNRLMYSYRLDEREWSPFQERREVSFAVLPAGKHYFQVRAMDRNGNVDPKPARLEFAIVEPWYRETRLVWILTLALGVAVFFAALAFNRHRRLQHSYAEVERQVAERTRELELANRELVHSQKMNALGTLAAGIAHDFNNILSIVKGSAQIIEENLDQPAKVRTRLDRIKTVVQQGAGIVEAMLGFGRGSSETPGPCDVNAVVNDTLTLLGDRFLREVEVRFDRDPSLPRISVTRDYVQQVLLNFIFNAAEAMERRAPNRPESDPAALPRADAEIGTPARKQITLTTRFVETPPPGAVLPPREASGYVAIAVQDCGCGISPEHLARLFEPFFTTKAMSARRGTGLGLSMVYELAKKLGAGLSVETTVGVGSVFSIWLPVCDVPDVQPQPQPANAS